MEALTLDRAKELAREVVTEFGEGYKYPEDHRRWNAGTRMCVYIHDDKPSCLVGQILHRHGVPVAELAKCEFRGAWEVTRELVPGTKDTTLRFLSELQGAQDDDNSWGFALEQALSV